MLILHESEGQETPTPGEEEEGAEEGAAAGEASRAASEEADSGLTAAEARASKWSSAGLFGPLLPNGIYTFFQ